MATESGGWETIVPSKQPAAKADTGGWETISKDVPSNKDIKTTALGTAGRSALETGATIPGMMYGAGVGARLGIAAMPFSGPLAPAMPLIGGVAGGLVAGVAQSMGINSLEQFADTVFGTNIVATKQAQAEQHPIAEKVGSLAGMVAGPGGAFANLSKIGTKEGLKTAATGAGMMVGIGGATRAVQGHDVFDTKEMLTDIAAGSLTGPSKLGEKLIAKGRGAPSSIKPPEASKPTSSQGSTPEEVATFLQQRQKAKAEGDAKAPLVETAFLKKEIGKPDEIIRSGPKHSEELKKDGSLEQGFVDDKGNFHERQAAVDQAKRAGQIPQDHVLENPTGEQPGLHSGDLRAVKDERFELTGERPVTLGDTTPPKFLYHGTKADTKMMITANGDLVLMPSKNFDGKTSSVSMTHNVDVANDYAARTKGGGPEGFDFTNAKTIKIHSDALPEGVGRESGEEWALNTDKPVVIPKGKFEVTEHPASKHAETPGLTHADFYEWAKGVHGEEGVETAFGEGREGELKKNFLEQMSNPEVSGKDVAAKAQEQLAEMQRLKDVADAKASGLYEEPAVQWGSDKPAKEPTPVPEDRTKTDPRDVTSDKEFEEIAQDIYEKHGDVAAVEFFKGYEEYKKTMLEPIKETERLVGTNLKNKAANERIIHNESKKMMEEIPDPERRVAIAEAVDKGEIETLTGKEREVADRYQALVKEVGDRAVERGVFKGLLDDYVSHIIDWAGAPKGAREEFIRELFGKGESKDPTMRGMTPTSKFAKERTFRTFAELEAFIKEANERIAASGKSEFRLKLKTKDIAEIYKEYATSMEKATENKALIDGLKQVRNANGESMVVEVTKENPLPHGWEMMDAPQFAGYAVHPDMMPALKFVFDAGPGDLMQAMGFISQLAKRMNVVGSFFHAKSLMEVMSSSGIPIWTPLKEAIVLPLVEKAVKAVTGKELQLSAVSKAVEQYKEGGVGSNVDKWIRESGLQLEVPEDVSKGVLTAVGKFADSMIGKYGPKTRVLESSLSTVEKYTLGLFDKYTWDYLHTGGKIMVADAYLDKARLTAAKQGKPFDEAASRIEIAKFVNDSFGGLNWFDAATQANTEFGKRMSMAAYSPQGRRALQVALFAPDWTVSTLRAFTSALPKSLNPTKWHPVEGVKGMMTPTTKADYARLYQFKTALTYFTLVNGINMMTANRPVWENKDPTRIEWPDGTSMQAMKHAMEPYHWIMDPDKTFANKLGFIPKAMIVGGAGVEYASPTAQKLVDPSFKGRAIAVAKMGLPFQVSAATTAPEGEGAKRAILGTMGFPIYGATKEQKKAARSEREKILKQAKKDYLTKAKDKGWTD